MFRTRNRLRPFAAVLVAVLLFMHPGFNETGSAAVPRLNSSVRILILSRNIKELKEGKADELALELPEGSYAESSSGNISLRKIIITCRGGKFIFAGGGAALNTGSIIINSRIPGSYFTFHAKEGPRLYPLPLEITASGGDPRLIVTEDIRRYSIDSAYAELGAYDQSADEALYALAHAVLARSLAVTEGAKHEGAHFCDLTCCQAYRGRTRFDFDDTVCIKAVHGRRIFFGSSGGGLILTDRIFGTTARDNGTPCRDVIFSENFTLSMERFPSWKAVISADELNSILYPAIKKRATEVIYSPERETMTLNTYEGPYRIAPETFRLVINRVKGWSFIKSNNYNVKLENGIFLFSGSGLGHCCGMSIEGAVQLSRRGYSRYEILEHYYPWITYDIPDPAPAGHYHDYIYFDMESGRVLKSTGGSMFPERKIPFGSVSKLLTVIYLASERRDIFYNYKYTCTSRHTDSELPEKCWEPAGHGETGIRSAVYNSCNLYFASLCRVIDMDHYFRWLSSFTKDAGIEIAIPQIKNRKEFASYLAGTDFRLTVTVRGLVRLAMLVADHRCSDPDLLRCRGRIRPAELIVIRDALRMTMTRGTGSGEKNAADDSLAAVKKSMWGKTGTVICGTNSHCGYGIFMGGCGGKGIVSIVRKSTGAIAADYSARILLVQNSWSNDY